MKGLVRAACAMYASAWVAAAPPPPRCALEAGGEAAVGKVVDAVTLTLSNGETVRLAGTLAPPPPPWLKAGEAWPLGEAGRAALETLVAGRTVEIRFAGRRRDRHNRLIAHLFVRNGPAPVWVQGALVGGGFVFASSLPRTRACQRALQRAEATARAARAGLWRHRVYAVAPANEPERLARRHYRFQIVEGRVVKVARTSRWTFVNFGSDWRSDFTIAVAARDRARFDGSDVALEALEGKRVRVRGWIERWNGPVIKATHPEQIEVLDETGADPPAPPPAGQKENPARGAPGSVDL